MDYYNKPLNSRFLKVAPEGENMLEQNRIRVQKMSSLEIWLFIIGRVLVGFGLGILAVTYLPGTFTKLGIPFVVIGLIILILASRGLLGKRS